MATRRKGTVQSEDGEGVATPSGHSDILEFIRYQEQIRKEEQEERAQEKEEKENQRREEMEERERKWQREQEERERR